MKFSISMNDLAVQLREHGRHSMLSYLSSLSIAVLRSLDTEDNSYLSSLSTAVLRSLDTKANRFDNKIIKWRHCTDDKMLYSTCSSSNHRFRI